KYDSDNKKVSLGMKQLLENPWETMSSKYPVGKIIKGKITNIAQYGVFVEIDNGIEGLVHISEISWLKNNISPAKILSIGQEVDVMVIEIDADHHRISLGIKQTMPNPWKIFADKYEVGDIVEGVIKNSTEFGFFVELEGGIDALLHISDLESDGDVKKYGKNDKIKVVVLSINYELERISVGVKQLNINLKEEVKKYIEGADLSATVKIIKKDFLEVEIDSSNLKGIVKKEYISKDKREQRTDKFKIGDILDTKVCAFNSKSGKLLLSLYSISDANDLNDDDTEYTYTGEEIKKDTIGSVFSNLFDKMKE
ncbi:MAG: S1 RNA-binding domain-containing protein, partial [Rickettsiales bacterium]|nr:S1 RNA-binding domain-containing protein [Rickettsiales bacterium]